MSAKYILRRFKLVTPKFMLGNSSGKKKICTLDELLHSETPEESNFEILQRASQDVDEQELSEALFSPGTVSYLHATR